MEPQNIPQYEITFKSAMMWANSELEHVGRIASMKDPNLQYAYALSTLNGMAHLKDALYQMVTDPAYEHHQQDLQRTHDSVVRVMRHLKTLYELDVDSIRDFNTRRTLSDLSYLETNDSNETNFLITPSNTPITPNNVNAYMSNVSNSGYSANVPSNNNSNSNAPANTIERMQSGGKRKTRKNRKSSKSRKGGKSRRH